MALENICLFLFSLHCPFASVALYEPSPVCCPAFPHSTGDLTDRGNLRGAEGLSLLVGSPLAGEAEKKLDKLSGSYHIKVDLFDVPISCTAARFSLDGTKLAVTTANAVVIYGANTGKEILSLPVSGATATSFSPRGTYLQTFHKPIAQQKNLMLWDLQTGATCFQLFQKAASKANWPAIQFSEDETVACRLVTNELHLYDGGDFAKGIVDKLRVLDIGHVQLASSPPTYIAAYVPEKKVERQLYPDVLCSGSCCTSRDAWRPAETHCKTLVQGAPAKACIFERSQVSQGQPTAQRNFYKSNTAQLMWNKGSTALLVLAHADIDNTNQSYYGESRLYFLMSDGNHGGAVPLSKEGPIHDVQWSPSGKDFLVVYGYMPARATLFDAKCKPLFDFGSGPYNVVRWNPHDHFICLAGFGNLPGDMAFWDRQTLKLLGSTKASLSVTSEWSPDGRTFMTATTAPRLQVDNGIKFFKYDGTLYHEQKYDKLYQAEWRPSPSELYPDRPPSPTSSRTANKQEQRSVVPVKPAAYRPPNASNSAAVKAQLFGEDNKANSPGLSKSALKNQKRRTNKQKESSETASANGTKVASQLLAADGAGVSEATSRLGGVSVESDTSLEENVAGGADVAKKLRALHKKLRKLDDMKVKVSGSGSKALTTSQQEKLSQESTLQAEIKALEALK